MVGKSVYNECSVKIHNEVTSEIRGLTGYKVRVKGDSLWNQVVISIPNRYRMRRLAKRLIVPTLDEL
jgi:hypothetical protein